MENVNEENAPITLGEYYRSLPDPQNELIRKLCIATKSSEVSVRRWLSGVTTPHPLKQEIIAKIVGKPMNELFPAKHIPERMEE